MNETRVGFTVVRDRLPVMEISDGATTRRSCPSAAMTEAPRAYSVATAGRWTIGPRAVSITASRRRFPLRSRRLLLSDNTLELSASFEVIPRILRT
jgi:hypothetical protein